MDIIIGCLLCYGLFRGFMNGFFVELAALCSTIAGIYAAIKCSGFVAETLLSRLHWNPLAVKALAFGLTFAAVIILISVLAKFLSGLSGLAGLGPVNKIGGACLGGLKFVLILGIAITFLEKLNDARPLIENEEDSVLYRPVRQAATAVFPVFKELWDKAAPAVSPL